MVAKEKKILVRTLLLPELSDLIYEERLKKLNLTTLQYRRHRMDMTQVFKIIDNIDDIQVDGLQNGLKDLRALGFFSCLLWPRVCESENSKISNWKNLEPLNL